MKYKINPEKVLFTQVGDEGVLYDIESNEYISVNETLFRILRGLAAGLTTEDIIRQLCDEYEVSEKRCSDEVMAVVEKLVSKNLISKN